MFVKDIDDKRVETKFCIPKWISENVIKILRQKDMKSRVKKMDHEKDNTVRDLRRGVVGNTLDNNTIIMIVLLSKVFG